MKHITLLDIILPETFLSLRLVSSYTSLLIKHFCKFNTEADTKMLIPITSQDVYIVTTAKNRSLSLFYHSSRRNLNVCYHIELLKIIDNPDLS